MIYWYKLGDVKSASQNSSDSSHSASFTNSKHKWVHKSYLQTFHAQINLLVQTNLEVPLTAFSISTRPRFQESRVEQKMWRQAACQWLARVKSWDEPRERLLYKNQTHYKIPQCVGPKEGLGQLNKHVANYFSCLFSDVPKHIYVEMHVCFVFFLLIRSLGDVMYKIRYPLFRNSLLSSVFSSFWQPFIRKGNWTLNSLLVSFLSLTLSDLWFI